MSSTLAAALWMIGAIVSFSTMAVAGRELGASHDTFEIMMYRGVVTLTSAPCKSAGLWALVNV